MLVGHSYTSLLCTPRLRYGECKMNCIIKNSIIAAMNVNPFICAWEIKVKATRIYCMDCADVCMQIGVWP